MLQNSRYGRDLVDDDDTPDPVHDFVTGRYFGHGTKCGGVAVMIADNEKCGVGVAPMATIGGKFCLTIRIAMSQPFA